MKSAVLTGFLLALAASAARTQQEDPTLEERKAEKLKSEFLKKADWILDFDKAKEQVQKSGKPMLTLFSRSYAPCPACHQLEHGLLLSEDFAKFAKGYVLYCHITTMIPGEKDGDLFEKNGLMYFPTIAFMDGSGQSIAVRPGIPELEYLTATGEKAKNFLALQAKSAAGDAAAKVDFAILEASLFRLSRAEAESRIEKAGPLSKEQQSAWEAARTNLSVREDMRSVKTDEDEAVLGRKYYARYKENRASLPTADQQLMYFAVRVLEASGEAKDPDTFEVVLKILKDKYGKIEDNAPFFEEQEKRLKDMHGGAKEKK